MNPHEGLRPLGPNGEGYCRVCRFVLALNEEGLIEPHTRGTPQTGGGVECEGTGSRPPKVTPRTSRKSMFKTKAPVVMCHVCKRMVPLLSDGRMNGHAVSSISVYVTCAGGFQKPQTV